MSNFAVPKPERPAMGAFLNYTPKSPASWWGLKFYSDNIVLPANLDQDESPAASFAVDGWLSCLAAEEVKL